MKVGDVPCPYVNGSAIGSQLKCVLPSGTGASRSVVVQTFTASSASVFNPAKFVSYRGPTISAVIGCRATASNRSIEDCDRGGMTRVTLIGSDFGARDASILVGGGAGANVHHDAMYPHRIITFDTPKGPGRALLIAVLQAAGEFGSDATLSYAQCNHSLYSSKELCLPCPNARYSNTLDAPECSVRLLPLPIRHRPRLSLTVCCMLCRSVKAVRSPVLLRVAGVGPAIRARI